MQAINSKGDEGNEQATNEGNDIHRLEVFR